MTKFVLAVTIALAIPSVAYAAEPEKKPCCCEKKAADKDCCDEKAKPVPMDHAHDMKAPKT